MPSGPAQPPSDITIGELWRTQQTILATLEALTMTLHQLPSQIVADVEARYSDRWNASKADSDDLHRQILTRLDRVEEWKQETHPVIVRTEDRVSLLQKAGWTVATLILSGDVGALFAVLTHK